MLPEKPVVSIEYIRDHIEEDQYKLLHHLLYLHSVNIYKSQIQSEEMLGLEQCLEEVEKMWDEGIIKIFFDETTEVIDVVYWNETSCDYNPL